MFKVITKGQIDCGHDETVAVASSVVDDGDVCQLHKIAITKQISLIAVDSSMLIIRVLSTLLLLEQEIDLIMLLGGIPNG